MPFTVGVENRFAGHFMLAGYKGTYGTNESAIARQDLAILTENLIVWSQVHGDFKDAAKRVLFQPYLHWPELYQCCKDVLREHIKLESAYLGPFTSAKIMGDVMTVMRARHKLNTPPWWLAIMRKLREKASKEK